MYILNIICTLQCSTWEILRNEHKMLNRPQQRKEEQKGTGSPPQEASLAHFGLLLSLWSVGSVLGPHFHCCVILVMVTSGGFLIDASACMDLFTTL